MSQWNIGLNIHQILQKLYLQNSFLLETIFIFFLEKKHTHNFLQKLIGTNAGDVISLSVVLVRDLSRSDCRGIWIEAYIRYT